MKTKPIYENTTKNRIQIINNGIPMWLNPGDRVVGDKFRVFMKMGLKEVPLKTDPVEIVDDDKKEEAPIKVRQAPEPKAAEKERKEAAKELLKELMMEDAVTLNDDVEVEIETAPEEVEVEEPEADEVEEEEEEGTNYIVGDALINQIVAEIGGENKEDAQEVSEEDEPVVVLDDEEIAVKEEHDDYPHKCLEEGCDRQFASERGLTSHSRVHKKV